MKRIAAVAVAAVLAGGAFTAWGLASTSSRTGAAKLTRATKLPPLPAAVKQRKRWIIGVKCDFPPFGYIDVRGRNDGYDVAVARRFAQLAFGRANRVALQCVTTPSRIPALTSNRVDIIISTLTWTASRAQQIDFSSPYYSATGRLLVPNNSSISSTRDLSDKTNPMKGMRTDFPYQEPYVKNVNYVKIATDKKSRNGGNCDLSRLRYSLPSHPYERGTLQSIRSRACQS